MGLLRRAAGAAVWGTSRAISRHVLPDTLIPSWKTKKRISRAGSLLTMPFRRKKKKKKKPASSSSRRSAGPATRPARFDRNAWKQGRALRPDASFVLPASSASASLRSSSPKPRKPSRLSAQLRDLRQHPQLVLQMKLDELAHDVKKLGRKVKERYSFRYH